VFGLLGVIIGGAITAGVDYFLDERRANREEAKEQRKRIIELKQAARLVDQDFNWALAAVTLALQFKQWQGHDSIQLETWQEHRTVLAAELGTRVSELLEWHRYPDDIKSVLVVGYVDLACEYHTAIRHAKIAFSRS